MKLHRVRKSVLHSWYHLSHSVETWIDLFWFALIDILLFGFLSTFLAGGEFDAKYLIAGIIAWEVVRIGQYTVTVGILWEIWSKSFSSLFISPLSLWEFIFGQAISGFGKAVFVCIVVSSIAYFAFDFSVFDVGTVPLFAYFMILFIFSVAAGIFVLSLIIRFGTNIQSLAWGLIFLVQPISAIFYPVEVLPGALQIASKLSPITYVMGSIRSTLAADDSGVLWGNVLIAFTLAFVYLVLSIAVTNYALKRAKALGAFARMGS